MTEVSSFRLYLRALYLLMAVGLGLTIWPQVIHHPITMRGSTSSLPAAVSVLAVLGIRYPLQMLPLLLLRNGLEDDLAGRRRASVMVSRSDRRGYGGIDPGVPDGRHRSDRNSLALRVLKLRDEAWGSLALACGTQRLG